MTQITARGTRQAHAKPFRGSLDMEQSRCGRGALIVRHSIHEATNQTAMRALVLSLSRRLPNTQKEGGDLLRAARLFPADTLEEDRSAKRPRRFEKSGAYPERCDRLHSRSMKSLATVTFSTDDMVGN